MKGDRGAARFSRLSKRSNVPSGSDSEVSASWGQVSALPRRTDIGGSTRYFRKVPQPDFCSFTQLPYRYSRGAQEVWRAPAA
jgi:hypothetical protein